MLVRPIELRRYGLRGSPVLSLSPLVEPDPTVFLDAQPLIDGVAHLRGPEDADRVAEIPGLAQRCEGDPCPDTHPPGALDSEDEVDSHDPGPEERRGSGHGFAGQ